MALHTPRSFLHPLAPIGGCRWSSRTHPLLAMSPGISSRAFTNQYVHFLIFPSTKTKTKTLTSSVLLVSLQASVSNLESFHFASFRILDLDCTRGAVARSSLGFSGETVSLVARQGSTGRLMEEDSESLDDPFA
jgi:hypothetical protein